MLSNKVYDVLKFVAQFVLPAMATLYFGLSKIWGFPYPEQVVGTIVAVDTFIGAILGLSTIQYNKQMAHLAQYVEPTMPATTEVKTSPVSISNSTYDILYWIAQIVLPAVGTLYFALVTLWPIPYGEQVIGTIALIDAVLGILLGINTSQYRKLNPVVPL